MNEAERLLRQIVTDPEGPCTTSHEGLDDGCFFCGGDIIGYDDFGIAEQEMACAWVAARRLFDLPVAPHRVKDGKVE